MRAPLLRTALLALVAAGASAAELEVGVLFTRTGSGTPPDTMGAVGFEHVVTLTNGGISIHRKSDGGLIDASDLEAFWLEAGVSNSDVFDPRVLFDPMSGRFFAVTLNGRYASNEILVAVSNGSDPTLGWTGFAFDATTNQNWADFPTIGVDADAVTVASDIHPYGQEGLPVGVDVLVLPKADLLAAPASAAGATLFESVGINKIGYAPQPITRLDGGGLPVRLVSSAVTFLGVLQTSRVTGTLDALAFQQGPFLLVEALAAPPEAHAVGGGFLDTGDGHVASPVQIGDSIWAVHGATGYLGNAAIRWYELDAATLEPRQSGVIEDPSLDLLYPSIAANARDQVVIGYSASSASAYPAAYAVLGETIGGITEFGAPVWLAAGTHGWAGGVGRFGDYSATVADPSDARRFWTFQEIDAQQGTIAVAELIVVPEPGPSALVAAAALALLAARARRT